MRRAALPKTESSSPDPDSNPLHCRDCPMWYGEENKGWGPCSIKHQRGAVQFITFGGHACDEGYLPAMKIPTRSHSRSGRSPSTSS